MRQQLAGFGVMFAIALVVGGVCFGVCGLGGGFMLMVALNGFSERQAEPVFITYFGLALLANLAGATAVNWLAGRRWFSRGWPRLAWAAGASLAAMILAALVGVPLALFLLNGRG